MKRLALLLLALSLAACTSPPANHAPASAQMPLPAPASPPAPPEPGDDLAWLSSPDLSRDQTRDGLVRLLSGPGADPAARLADLFNRRGFRAYGPATLPYAVADLDGDHSQEYVTALPVTDPGRAEFRRGTGAALFVIYRQDGRWQVDRSDPMSELAETRLMGPSLHAVADLAGTGRPQIVWSRPHMIASGLQPSSFFVTAWQPGAFTNLPGEMAVSRTTKDPAMMTIEGNELVLTGGSRSQMFLPAHTDRYRYTDGTFRLLDRHFVNTGDTGYAQLWDGLVAEEVGRLAEAELSYRAAVDPSRQPHGGSVPRYNMPASELGPADMAAFGHALHALARFRLGALLKDAGQESEATAVLSPDDSPYAGLLATMRDAPDRQAGCQAAAAWAEGHPEFLAAFNRGVSDQPWTPGLLCGHVRLDDTLGGRDP